MRKSTIEFTMTIADDDVNFNVEIERTVPGNDDPAHMNVKVHLSEPDGNYDPAMKVLEIKGIDTLEIQGLLKQIGHEIAQMTGVHVQ